MELRAKRKDKVIDPKDTTGYAWETPGFIQKRITKDTCQSQLNEDTENQNNGQGSPLEN